MYLICQLALEVGPIQGVMDQSKELALIKLINPLFKHPDWPRQMLINPPT